MILLGRTLAAATMLSMAPVWMMQASAAPKVVSSIKPVHSLVASVMQGVATPDLLVGGASSPHAYALKPSQAQALEDADVIFWIGPELEAFLQKPIATIGGDARVVALTDTGGLNKLVFRTSGLFEPHDHGHDGEHADDGHTEVGHSDEDAHHHEQAHGEDHAHGHADDHGNDDEHAHGDDHGHSHGAAAFDAHVWLDPVNAKLFVGAIGETLSQADPENAANYSNNVKATQARLDALIAEVNDLVVPARGKGFIVFHDAYQYFEKRFGIEASGSVTVNPEVKPSAERLARIRDKVRELDTVCAFAEPQFDGRLIDVVIEGTEAKSATLDPLGSGLEDGPELYFNLIREMATSMTRCLTASG
jgi:zinc transport system substrate-binding protein